MGEISAFDIIVCLMLLGGMAAGFARGFVRQTADLAALYVGLAVAAQYTPMVTPALDRRLLALPTYAVTALTFFLLVGIVTAILSLVAQSLLHSSQKQELNEISHIAGFAVGALATYAFISVSVPVIRYGVAASWGAWEGVRQVIIASLNHSYLRPLFESFTPTMLSLLQPLLPSGLPDVLRGRLSTASPDLDLLLHL
ncbi:MAG: CvpA family protein [Anaerolineae bacterium]|nr:CvpA family protein [Anaerolineae bacterium]